MKLNYQSAKVRKYFIAKHPSNCFAEHAGNTMQDLLNLLDKQFAVKPHMDAENIAYWAKHRSEMQFFAITEIIEEVVQSNTDEA